MPYFLSSENLASGKVFQLVGEEARHILFAHRTKIGEKIKLQGPNGQRFLCIVERIERNALSVSVQEPLIVPKEPPKKVSLYQAFISEKALDLIFQKATELGASEIVLFNSSRTPTKIDKQKFAGKLERWEKILWEAAKQSERAQPPKLIFIDTLSEVLVELKGLQVVLVCDVTGQPITKEIVANQSCGVVIGPEGGLTKLELEQLSALSNCKTVSLGPVLLRAETAALASLAIVRALV